MDINSVGGIVPRSPRSLSLATERCNTRTCTCHSLITTGPDPCNYQVISVRPSSTSNLTWLSRPGIPKDAPTPTDTTGCACGARQSGQGTPYTPPHHSVDSGKNETSVGRGRSILEDLHAMGSQYHSLLRLLQVRGGLGPC